MIHAGHPICTARGPWGIRGGIVRGSVHHDNLKEWTKVSIEDETLVFCNEGH